MAVLIDAQGDMLDNIENQVQKNPSSFIIIIFLWDFLKSYICIFEYLHFLYSLH